MALFQPSFIIPDVRSGIGNGVVDATQDMTVSWKINGQSALVAYSITLYTNNAASLQLYTTGKITTNCPAYGTSPTGQPQMFSYVIPAAALATARVTNGYEYKLVITQWWGETDADSITQSSASVFVTREAPTLTINTIGTDGVIDTRYYTFSGTYTQAQNDILNWFRWRIANANDTDHPLYDSGNVTGTMDLSCYYDGFFTGSSYVVRLTAQTESGVEIDTNWVNFACSYETQQPVGSLTAGCVGGTDAVFVQWDGVEHVEAETVGPYSFKDGYLDLPSGSSVTWPKTGTLGFAPNWCVILSAHIVKNFEGTLMTVECAGGVQFRLYTKNVEPYIENDYTLCIDFIEPGSSVATAVFNSHPRENVDEYDLTFVITPLMYMGTTADPAPHRIWAQYSYDTSEQTNLNRITLTGPMLCKGIEVVVGDLPEDVKQEVLDGSYQIGSMSMIGNGDYMAASWIGGDVDSDAEPDAILPYLGGYLVQKFSLYRLQNETGAFTKVGTTSAYASSLYDYGARSQQGPYTYYLFPEDQTTFNVAPLQSGMVMPCWWNWTLMECAATDDPKIFSVLAAYRFRLNVESGAVSNNNTPNILPNFTPYPKVQLAPQNYKSGTLYGLIGAVDWGEGSPVYLDTIEWRDALYALSLTKNPLFLKNRKGDLLRIRVSAPIVMTTADQTTEQMQTISFPWVEVGSTEGVSLFSTSYAGVQSKRGDSNPQYYVDASDATAGEANIRTEKTAYGPDGKIIGEAKVQIDGSTLIMPEGMEV